MGTARAAGKWQYGVLGNKCSICHLK